MFHSEIEDLVSIIVPVYNVSEYLDRCLNTLVNQTYSNIQIILINDGSTDDSAEKCMDWQRKDSRIYFISKKNEHQGPCRNLGIWIADGKYVMFVDPDDYVELTYVEKMYKSITKNFADMVVCDIYRVENGIKKELLSNYDIKETDNYRNNKILLFTMSGALWAKIYRRKLFVKNGIIQSSYNGQDSEVFPELFVMSERVAQVKEPLYNYVIDREGNATTTGLNQVKGVAPIVNNVVKYFKDRELFDDVKDELEKFLTRLYIYAFYYNSQKREFRPCVTDELHNNTVAVLKNNFENWTEEREERILQIGNPSTRPYVMNINPFSSFFSGECLTRYQFSSIISMLSEKEDIRVDIKVKDNSYRQEMVEKDISKAFQYKCEEELSKMDYVLLDFLEERYDIIKYKNSFFTKNDIVSWGEDSNKSVYHVLKRNSLEVTNMWKQKCLELISILKSYFSPNEVFLVEQYASKEMRDYKCSCSAKEINEILHEYYEFFKQNYEGITVWEGN